MRITHLATRIALPLLTLAALAADTAPAPKTLTIHMTPFKLDLSFQIPAGWQVDRLPTGYPMVYLPPDSGNQAAADWTFEFRQNDIGPKPEDVIKHMRDIYASSQNITIDESGPLKFPTNLPAGFLRYHPTDSKTAMVRTVFLILPSNQILWINEHTLLTPWPQISPTLATLTNSLTLKPIK